MSALIVFVCIVSCVLFHVRSFIPKQDQYDGQVNVLQCVENISMSMILYYFEKVVLQKKMSSLVVSLW